MIDILIFAAVAFFVWWSGYFTACLMMAGKRADEQSDEYEQIRRPEL